MCDGIFIDYFIAKFNVGYWWVFEWKNIDKRSVFYHEVTTKLGVVLFVDHPLYYNYYTNDDLL